MDRTATPNRRMAKVERRFERSRLSEEVLASAYERLVPIVRRPAGLPQEHPQHALSPGSRDRQGGLHHEEVFNAGSGDLCPGFFGAAGRGGDH